MKNIILAICGLTIVACQNNKTTNTVEVISDSVVSSVSIAEMVSIAKMDSIEKTFFKDSLAYKVAHYYKETKRSNNATDSSSYGYVKAIYPNFAVNQKFLNNKILSIITAEPWTGNITYSIEKASEKFLKEYLEFKKDYPDSPAGYTWDQSLKVSFQDVNLAVLTSNSYIYTGGAHGLESVLYFNLDLKSEKELALTDLLNGNYKNKLTAVAESIFRKNEGLTEDEPLDNYFFENKIFKLNENFAITKKGLFFTYNPYEIKSYAEGRTNLLIPYSRIKDLIKPNSFISKYVNK